MLKASVAGCFYAKLLCNQNSRVSPSQNSTHVQSKCQGKSGHVRYSQINATYGTNMALTIATGCSRKEWHNYWYQTFMYNYSRK